MDYPKFTEKDTEHMNKIVHEVLYSGRRVGFSGFSIALVEGMDNIARLLAASLKEALQDTNPYVEITTPLRATAIFHEDGLDKAVTVEAKQLNVITERKGFLRKRKLFVFDGFDMHYIIRWPGRDMMPASIMWVVVRLSSCLSGRDIELRTDTIKELESLQLNIPGMNAWIRRGYCNWVMACVRMRGRADIVFDDKGARAKKYRVHWRSGENEEKMIIPCAPLFAPIGARHEPDYSFLEQLKQK